MITQKDPVKSNHIFKNPMCIPVRDITANEATSIINSEITYSVMIVQISSLDIEYGFFHFTINNWACRTQVRVTNGRPPLAF